MMMAMMMVVVMYSKPVSRISQTEVVKDGEKNQGMIRNVLGEGTGKCYLYPQSRSGAACHTVASPAGQCRTVYNFCIASIFLHSGLCWGGVWLGGELKDEKFQVYNQNYPILLRCTYKAHKEKRSYTRPKHWPGSCYS